MFLTLLTATKLMGHSGKPQRFELRADISTQGYDPDHKDIDLLRLKSFTLSRSLQDQEVLGPGGLARITELIATLVPFVSDFLFISGKTAFSRRFSTDGRSITARQICDQKRWLRSATKLWRSKFVWILLFRSNTRHTCKLSDPLPSAWQ